jgi:HSP20 family protein
MRIVPFKQREQGLGIFDEIEELQQEMNRLFDMTIHSPMKKGDGGSHWSPTMDMIDEKDKIMVSMDMPGMKKDDIEISLQNDMLMVKGEKKEEREINEKDMVRSERFYGTFQRAIPLSASVDESKVEANYKDGVLEIIMPKKEEAKQKQIKVNIK